MGKKALYYLHYFANNEPCLIVAIAYSQPQARKQIINQYEKAIFEGSLIAPSSEVTYAVEYNDGYVDISLPTLHDVFKRGPLIKKPYSTVIF